MIKQISKIAFQQIKRISPSQFHLMKKCPYKFALSAALENSPLLPLPAEAYWGIVSHKLREKISRYIVKDHEEFEVEFNNSIKELEDELFRFNFDFFVPLVKNIKDLGVKKILLKKLLHKTGRKTFNQLTVDYCPEKWIESVDGKIAGIIDLVIQGENGVEIIDYKSGRVFDLHEPQNANSRPAIKECYAEQLKLYAALYHDKTGIFPIKLSLVDSFEQKHSIAFTIEECLEIYIDAKKFLDLINKQILDNNIQGNPCNENCKYCQYRPACSFYLEYIKNSSDMSDVSGELLSVAQFINGNVSIELSTTGSVIKIDKIKKDYYEDLQRKLGKNLSIFNLYKNAELNRYSFLNYTMTYETYFGN